MVKKIFLLPPLYARGIENCASLNILDLSGVKWEIKMIRGTLFPQMNEETFYRKSETLTLEGLNEIAKRTKLSQFLGGASSKS